MTHPLRLASSDLILASGCAESMSLSRAGGCALEAGRALGAGELAGKVKKGVVRIHVHVRVSV